MIMMKCDIQHGITMFGGGAPAYTPPPAVPPQAAPPTLASASVAESAATKLNQNEAAISDYGTSGGAQGVSPDSVNRAVQTLGGVQ